MFIEGKVWNGLNEEEMAEVHSRIEPTGYKSPVTPLKPKREKSKTSRMQGKVKMFQAGKGFGFIWSDNNEEFFFHISTAVDPDLTFLMRGEPVTFEVGEDKQGRQVATKVKLV